MVLAKVRQERPAAKPHLDEFVQSLKRCKRVQQNDVPAWVRSIARLLRECPLEGETIRDISDRMKVSRVHLSRSFKKHYSVSAVKYRQHVRFGNLLHCLASTNKSLAEASYECGFSDQSQMSRTVLKETGYTPQALRLLLREF